MELCQNFTLNKITKKIKTHKHNHNKRKSDSDKRKFNYFIFADCSCGVFLLLFFVIFPLFSVTERRNKRKNGKNILFKQQ